MQAFKIFRIPLVIIGDLAKLFLVYMPGSSGFRLRRIYYQKRLKHCGKNLVVDVGVQMDGLELISFGDNVHIDKYCVISTGKKLIGEVKTKNNSDYKFSEGEIVVGSNVHVAQFCILMGYGGIQFDDKVVLSAGSKIYSLTNTAYDSNDRAKVVSIMPYEFANFFMCPVVLGQNVWLGLNTIVMPGVVVGKDSFCVSNSLLMNKFEENSYISGQPAERISERFIPASEKV